MLFHQIGKKITAVISMTCHFTTKSDGIWKKQMVLEAGDEGLTAAELFYSLAA